MSQDMLDSAGQREKIRRLIFEPLEGRGEPPRGWTKEHLLADYCLALGRYPETVLEAAAAKVRAARVRTTWPLAGDYQAACDALMVDEPPALDEANLVGQYRRSKAAYDYIARRMAANDHALWHRTLAGGRDALERWMFGRACEQLRAGNDPVIPDAEVDAEIDAILDRHADARAKVEAVTPIERSAPAQPSRWAAAGPVAQRVVDQAGEDDLEL
jgi:hypothetical protein